MATDNHKPDNTPAVVSFAGYSGSGKTTLVEKVIKILTDRGYKVGRSSMTVIALILINRERTVGA